MGMIISVPLIFVSAGLLRMSYDTIARLYDENFVYPAMKAIDGYIPPNRWQDYVFVLITTIVAFLILALVVRLCRRPTAGTAEPKAR